MGSFQASMLEAFQSLRDKLTTKNKQRWIRPRLQLLCLDPPLVLLTWTYPPPRPRTTSHVEEMEVDYGPALPPRLSSDLHNASDQNSDPSEEPSKKVLDRPKNTLTLTKGMMLNRGPPRINTMMNPMNLGFHLLNPKKT